MSTEIIAAVHGIAPRSAELLQLGGDVERGRASRDEYEVRLAEEQADWFDLQIDAGIDRYEHNKLRWQDHLRPIVKASTGFAPDIDNAPVTRWFEDNRFYRQPTFVDQPQFNFDSFVPEGGWPGKHTSLISPATFADLCGNETLHSNEELAVNLYTQIVDEFYHSGVRDVLFEDYGHKADGFLAPDCDLTFATTTASRYPDLQVGLISHGGLLRGGSETLPQNLILEGGRTDYSAHTHLPAPIRQLVKRRSNWQQVVDASTTKPDEFDVADWSPELIRRLAPTKIILTHSVDLEHLPLAYAQDKVKRLGEFAHKLREHLEEVR